MPKPEDTVKREIKAHIDKEGSGYPSWYVGIAENPKERLREHGVSLGEGEAWWIHRKTSSSEVARRVERYFVKQLGTDGGPGGGTDASVHVYAYLKSSRTDP